MGYMLVVVIAKLLRVSPEELWHSIAMKTMWVLIYFVFFVLLYAFVGWGVGHFSGDAAPSIQGPRQIVPTTTTTDPYVIRHYNENGEQVGVTSITPTLGG